jgi:AraC family transcriptional regulator
VIKYIVVGLLVAIIVFVARTAIYVGAFRDVAIQSIEAPAQKLIFKTHIGAYHKIVPIIEEVEAWAKSQNIDCHLSFGEYLDNPDLTEEDRLRSHGGCVVSDFPSNMPAEFETKEIPAQKVVEAIFEGAPSIGPLKVYPKVQKFADEQRLLLKGSVIEIYEIHPELKARDKMTTTYHFFLQ